MTTACRPAMQPQVLTGDGDDVSTQVRTGDGKQARVREWWKGRDRNKLKVNN